MVHSDLARMPELRTHSLSEILRHPLFQVSTIATLICLILALAFWFLGLGKPDINAAILLDMSNSTHKTPSELITPTKNSILSQEITAVNTYLDLNQALRRPNTIKIWGFGGTVAPLTSEFSRNPTAIQQELNETIRPDNLRTTIERIAPNQTNLSQAINQGVADLSQQQKGCRELILVTDGAGTVEPQSITNAIQQKTKLNVVLIGNPSPALQQVAEITGGLYLAGMNLNLQELFEKSLFQHFNNNWHWIIFWLGMAWISLNWMLCLPLKVYFLQGFIHLHWHEASRYALSYALFWTTATIIIVWKICQGLPLLSAC